MIITTAGRTNEKMTLYAKEVADDLDCRFVARRDAAVKALQQRLQEDVLVVGKNRLEIYPLAGDDSFFFHPNSAGFRVKRLLRGEHDPFLQAAKIEQGMSVLDCTLGMGSDAILASLAAGEAGRVTGIEANRYVAYLVKKGLREWQSDVCEMNEAMRRVEVVHAEHTAVLQACGTDSYDIVYLDPMFEESILESDGIRSLKQFALYDDIMDETIREAQRVARCRVVLKDHFRSPRFARYGFSVYSRKSAKFHFGVLEKSGSGREQACHV